MRLSRAAFAVTLKFSDSIDEFEDLMAAVTEDKDENAVDDYPEVLKRWEQASKIRQWINQKKLKLVEERKTETMKKMADEKHKKYLKDKEDREKAKEEKESKENEDKPEEKKEEAPKPEEDKPKEEKKEEEQIDTKPEEKKE
jgi:hypothetical protein